MRKILFGVIITLIVLFSFKYCGDKKQDQIVLKETSRFIQEELKNVGKLIVTEGHFSEVFNYENSKEILGDLYTADKKALVVVNADVSIAYDLELLEYKIDQENKILQIISIPAEEIIVNPDLEYYDIQSDFLNPFKAEDYNAIKETVNTSMLKKIEHSKLKSNAKNRLLSELSKFYILTNSMGWSLEFNENTNINIEDLKILKY